MIPHGNYKKRVKIGEFYIKEGYIMTKIISEGYAIYVRKSDSHDQLMDFELKEEYLFNKIEEEIKAGSERISICYFKVFPNPDFLSFCEIIGEKEFNMYFKRIR